MESETAQGKKRMNAGEESIPSLCNDYTAWLEHSKLGASNAIIAADYSKNSNELHHYLVITAYKAPLVPW
jgi:hypothetical protein